jgi:transposase
MVTQSTTDKSDSILTDITAETPASKLPNDVAILQQMVLQLLGQIHDQARENMDLKFQLEYLKRQVFGRKSEKMDPAQKLLFENLFQELDKQLEAQQVQQSKPADENAPGSDQKNKPAKQPSRRNGRVPLPADLPRVTEYKDPEPHLIEGMRCIGEDITEILEYIPAGFYVRKIVRRKYAQADGSGTVVMAPLPALPIEKGRPGPGVLAHIITSKYCDHLPLYRLEQIFERHGLQVHRSTQCDWIRDSAHLLEPIVLEAKRQILASDVIHTDDTYIPVQDKARTQVRKGYLWPYIDKVNNVYFHYTTERNREGPADILSGYTGRIQADGFNGYDDLYGDDKATEVGCWGHARRKFDYAQKSDPVRSNPMLALIAQLYVVEQKAKDKGFDADEIKSLRQQFSKPIIENEIAPLLARWQQEVLPKSPMGEAVTYATNQWQALKEYLEDGMLCIDNGLAERTIKLVALGRNYVKYRIM